MTKIPRILAVDDDADALDIYRVALSRSGIDLTTTQRGATAIQFIKEAAEKGEPFDLVITDLVLMLDIAEEVTGIDVARETRRVCPLCKIVMVTGRDDFFDEVEARQLGLIGLWAKPVHNFRDKVEGLLYMPEAVTRRTGFFHKAKNLVGMTPAAWGLWTLLLLVVIMQAFQLYRAPYMFGSMGRIERKLDGAVSTHQLPSGYRVYVPAPKAAYKVMEDGSARVTFQFEPKDAAAAESLAKDRGVPLWLSVTRGK